MNASRKIERRERGQAHGPITRLISPEGLGDQLKPFIFLDFFDAEITPGFGFPMHPHSGIATLTWQPGCDVQYEDTTGQRGLLKAGGLEWMNAGGGAWHQGRLMGQGRATGFQLWVPMPPGVEDGRSVGQYVAPPDVARRKLPGGEVIVLLGSLPAAAAHAATTSPIESHQDMDYLVLELEPGARWCHEPPLGHDVAWAFVFEGSALVQGEMTRRELLAFERGEGKIEFVARDERVRAVMGSARRHPHPLVLASSSVHTNPESLARGLSRIHEIGRELVDAGRLRGP